MAGPLKGLIFTPTPTLEVWPILLHQSPWWSSLVCLDPETKSREFSPPQGNEKPRVPPHTRERKAQNSLPQSLSPNNFYERVSSRELVALDRCLVCILEIPPTNTQDLLLLFTLGSDSVLHHPQQHDHATNGVTFTTANARCTTRECSVVFQ